VEVVVEVGLGLGVVRVRWMKVGRRAARGVSPMCPPPTPTRQGIRKVGRSRERFRMVLFILVEILGGGCYAMAMVYGTNQTKTIFSKFHLDMISKAV